MSTAVAKQNIDVAKVFLAYLSFQGDYNRTALACDLEPETVRDLAVSEAWASKIEQFAELREQDSNAQINLNRTVNFVQARQLAGLVDAVIQHLNSSPEVLIDSLTATSKNGSVFNTKPLTDLVRAAEAIQGMTARALGDAGTPLAGDKVAGGTSCLSVARALNVIGGSVGLDAVTIVKKNLELRDANPERHSPPPPSATS